MSVPVLVTSLVPATGVGLWWATYTRNGVVVGAGLVAGRTRREAMRGACVLAAAAASVAG